MTNENMTPAAGHNSGDKPVTLAALVKTWHGAEGREVKAKLLLCDFIVAAGGTSTTLKEKDNPLRVELDAAIVSCFTQTVRNLLDTPSKDIKFKDAAEAGYPKGHPASKDFKSKAGKKYWQQQIGSYRGKIIAALRVREEGGKKGAQSKPKDYAERTVDMLTEINKRLKLFVGDTKKTTGTLHNVQEAMEIVADALVVLGSHKGMSKTTFLYSNQTRRK
tara:strand:- start:64 stop:720 length:657 start_codon:yes stop_codon:yes gene_type:complete